MKKFILHLSGTFLKDGATSSVINLSETLKTKEIKSTVYILKDREFSNKIKFFNQPLLFKVRFYFLSKIENFVLRIIKINKHFAFFNNIIKTNSLDIIKNLDPDIVHFHWIPRLLDLNKISNIKSKIVITMRDYWFITGGCNYPVNCKKYELNCGKCPHLKNIGFEKDFSYFNLKKKRENIRKNKNNINLVVPNIEMRNEIKKLKLFNPKKIFYIPNGINKNKFYINKKNKSGFKLKSKNKKKIILFGAQNLNQEWKGLKYILELSKIINNSKFLFMSFGFIDNEIKYKIKKNIEYIDLGYISNEDKLRNIYNTADYFVFPSSIETFGKVILESIFCGTPVIAFNSYAAKDIITHKIDGYLVSQQNAKAILKGIEFFYKNKNNKNLIKESKKKIKNYDIDEISKKYINLYDKI